MGPVCQIQRQYIVIRDLDHFATIRRKDGTDMQKIWLVVQNHYDVLKGGTSVQLTPFKVIYEHLVAYMHLSIKTFWFHIQTIKMIGWYIYTEFH